MCLPRVVSISNQANLGTVGSSKKGDVTNKTNHQCQMDLDKNPLFFGV